MGDPGFVAAIIAELVHRIIIAAEKAYRCRQYCKSLQSLLIDIEPVVKHAIDQSNYAAGNAVHQWLLSLKIVLEEAERAVDECSKSRLINPFLRYGTATRILKIAERIRTLCQQSPLVVLNVVLSIQHKLESGMKKMQDEQRRMELAITTRHALRVVSSCARAKERAFNDIKMCADNLVTGGVDLSNSKAQASTSGFNIDNAGCVEYLQPVPQAVFGLDDITEKLKSMVLEGTEAPRCVGIWGKGGSGKTLLAQRVHNHLEVHEKYRHSIIWLTIGRNPSIEGLYDSLSSSIGASLWTSSSLEDSKTILYNELLRRRVLLVLDDFWEESLLEWLDIAKGPGSLTLVTSRKQSVLQRANATEFVVLDLSLEDSWKLFCVHAFGGVEKAPSGSLEKTAKLVAAECKGLPLALKVIGGAMVGKKTLGQWELDLHKLRDSRVLDQNVEVQLFHRLKLSYDELDTVDPRAKQCFLYFAAFPEDRDIDADNLIWYWIGEKLVGTHGEDPTEDAYCLLGLLIGRSLIELFDCFLFEHNFKFKVHDVLRDLALHTLEHNIPVHNRQCLFRAGRGLREFPPEWLTTKGQQLEARRISLKENEITALPNQLRAPHLHTLILEGSVSYSGENSGVTAVPKDFFQCISNLMVLDLNSCNLTTLPESLGHLKSLMHLDLSYNYNLVKLPNSVKNLQRLQHLFLQRCMALEPLPLGVTKLTTLTLLNLDGSSRLWRLSPGAGSISALSRTMSGLKDGGNQILVMEDIATHLLALKALQLSDHTHLPVGPYSFKKLRRLELRRLAIDSLPEAMCELTDLEILKIEYCAKLTVLPPWIEDFHQLRAIQLTQCPELTTVPALDKLPLLVELIIMQCDSLVAIPHSFTRSGSFPAMEAFRCRMCKSLVAIPPVETGAMPKLKVLDLFGSSFKTLTPTLAALSSLRHLELGNVRLAEGFFEVDLASFVHLEMVQLGFRTADELNVLPPFVRSLSTLKFNSSK